MAIVLDAACYALIAYSLAVLLGSVYAVLVNYLPRVNAACTAETLVNLVSQIEWLRMSSKKK